EATSSGRLDHLEPLLLDLLSLGQRFNWAQLVQFMAHIEETETLRQLTVLVRQKPESLPVLFAAVELSGQPAEVARYLMDFSQSGLPDLSSGLGFGAGGLKELINRDLRLCASPFAQYLVGYAPCVAFLDFAAFYAWHNPWLALALKW